VERNNSARPRSPHDRGGATACTSNEDVQVICPSDRRAHPRLETGGGLRRTWVGRELTWRTFIIWRWAGPALAGWTRCRWKARQRPLPPRRLRPMTISVSLRPGAAVLHPGDQPRNRVGSHPPVVRPRRPLARAPGNQPSALPRRVAGPPPESGAGVRLARVPAGAAPPGKRAPGGRPPGRRAPGGRPLGRAQRRDAGAAAAGGNARQGPFSTRARAAAQLISAM
jgi:hypothetical protein